VANAADLVAQQDRLQAEADAVGDDLRLDALLSALGEPVRVGSAALGLMVRRDLDVAVICPKLGDDTLAAVAQVGARLAVHPRVQQVGFRNETGDWNTDPSYPDGLYVGLRYRSAAGRDWTLDIWFIDEPDRKPALVHLRTVPHRLSPDVRTTILAIKHAWADRADYGTSVHSYDVYRSVLDDGVRTPEEFEEWRSRP
jgi:hypothetical protein